MQYSVHRKLHTDFSVFEENKLPARSYFIPFSTAEKVHASDYKTERYTSDRVLLLSGEWDFYDVAQELTGRAGRRAPAPVYSPNSAGNQAGLSVANMSDEQFDRLNQSLASGRRYDMR